MPVLPASQFIKICWHLWRRVRGMKAREALGQQNYGSRHVAPKVKDAWPAQGAESILTPKRVFCSVFSFVFCADFRGSWTHRHRGKRERRKRSQRVNLFRGCRGQLAYHSVLSHVLDLAALLSAINGKGCKTWELFFLNVLEFFLFLSSSSLLCSH